MVLTDVNVLVYAARRDMPDHRLHARWVREMADGDEAFALSDLVLSGFLRIVTNRRIFKNPTSLDRALAFVDALRSQPNCVLIRPGDRHWAIFAELATKSGAKGGLIPDAYFAALAIESGCEWITTDRDFARFPGLRWRHPLDAE